MIGSRRPVLVGSIRELNILPRPNLFRLVGELPVMFKTLLSIRNIIAECALGLFLRGKRHLVAVQKAQIIEIGAVRQAVLRQYDMSFSLAGLIKQRRDTSPRIRSANIHRPWRERPDHG